MILWAEWAFNSFTFRFYDRHKIIPVLHVCQKKMKMFFPTFSKFPTTQWILEPKYYFRDASNSNTHTGQITVTPTSRCSESNGVLCCSDSDITTETNLSGLETECCLI